MIFPEMYFPFFRRHKNPQLYIRTWESTLYTLPCGIYGNVKSGFVLRTNFFLWGNRSDWFSELRWSGGIRDGERAGSITDPISAFLYIPDVRIRYTCSFSHGTFPLLFFLSSTIRKMASSLSPFSAVYSETGTWMREKTDSDITKRGEGANTMVPRS